MSTRTAYAADTPSIVTATAQVALAAAPIDPAWLIDASAPVTEAAEVACSHDRTTCVYLWQTTAAIYRWEHESDETITVLDGEVFVRDEGGAERRLGPQDVAFFPCGARTVWRVPHRFRKISVLTRPLPRPAARMVHGLRVLKRWVRERRRFAAPRPAAAYQRGSAP